MSMSDHIKQQVVQEFFPQNVSFSWKTAKTGFFKVFYQSGRSSKHFENMLHNLSQGSVAHCFKLLNNVWYRTTERIILIFFCLRPIGGEWALKDKRKYYSARKIPPSGKHS